MSVISHNDIVMSQIENKSCYSNCIWDIVVSENILLSHGIWVTNTFLIVAVAQL